MRGDVEALPVESPWRWSAGVPHFAGYARPTVLRVSQPVVSVTVECSATVEPATGASEVTQLPAGLA